MSHRFCAGYESSLEIHHACQIDLVMVYSCLSSSTLLRSRQLVSPRTFLRYKSITAAIERGRQGGPDRPFRPRTRNDRNDERDEPVKNRRETRREARFEKFGPPRDDPEPRFGDRSTVAPRSSRFGRIPRDDDAPSRSKEERPSGFGRDRSNGFGRERPSDLGRERQGGFQRERQSSFGRDARGTGAEQGSHRPSEAQKQYERLYGERKRSPHRLDPEGRRNGDIHPPETFQRYDDGYRPQPRMPNNRSDSRKHRTNDRNDSRKQRPERNWRDDRAPSYTPRTRDVADEGVTEARFSQRGDDATSYSPRARDENDRSFEPRFSHRPDSKGARRERHGRESSDAGAETQKPSVRGPESLPYTTAASEFVYGYGSVVAAIKADRRKFYNLYVHSRGASREGLMSRIRSHKLFPITQEVGDEYMRALDKASSGRPHNGVILEASPLPVPPITELKTASLEDESFRVTLDSQSAEDLLVNGKQELYSYKSGGWRHPLILYVDGVVSTTIPSIR